MLMSPELYNLLEQAEADCMEDRMLAIQQRPDNPEGVELHRFGGALALYSRTMPWPQFNAVKMVTKETISYLEDILRFYDDRQRKPSIEVTPGNGGKELLRELHRYGFYQSGFHSTMYTVEEQACPQALSPEITIRRLGREDAERYASIHCLGTGLGEQGIPYVTRNNEVLMDRDGWGFYAAEWLGEPCAVGVMYVKGRTASLTFAATLPEFRGRGLHTAVLQARLADAFQAGCEVVVSQAAYASQSYRNMEKVGMRLGYTRATWSKD